MHCKRPHTLQAEETPNYREHARSHAHDIEKSTIYRFVKGMTRKRAKKETRGKQKILQKKDIARVESQKAGRPGARAGHSVWAAPEGSQRDGDFVLNFSPKRQDPAFALVWRAQPAGLPEGRATQGQGRAQRLGSV